MKKREKHGGEGARHDHAFFVGGNERDGKAARFGKFRVAGTGDAERREIVSAGQEFCSADGFGGATGARDDDGLEGGGVELREAREKKQLGSRESAGALTGEDGPGSGGGFRKIK